MSGSSPETTSSPGSPLPAVLAATFVVVVLATWAAAIGPDRVFGSDPTPRETETQEQVEREPAHSERGEADEEDEERGWGTPALFMVEMALLVVVVYLLVLLVRWFRSEFTEERRRRRRRRVEFEVLPASPEQAAEEIVRDADQQLALLRGGSPRNGIVACWHRFEVQAEAVGLGREPWETSAEFTLRVLDLVSADEHAVAELSVLYREARFSDHDLNEAARAAAVRALQQIHRGLGARFAGGPA
jgi:hypothetical protein